MLLKDIPMQSYNTAMANYPLDASVDRVELNNAIYNYYTYYELSFCNVEKWLHNLAARMRIIMPRYNQIYASIALRFDPLKTYEYTRAVDHSGTDTHQINRQTTENNNENGTINNDGNYTTANRDEQTTTSKTDLSTFPQGNLLASGNSNNSQLYLDNETKNNGSTETTSNVVNTHNDETISSVSRDTVNNVSDNKNATDEYNDNIHEEGTAPGSNYSKLVADYRALAISVEEMIIEELRDLFFSSFDTTDFGDCIPYGVYPWYK